MSSYKELVVWQKAYQLTLDIYSTTKKFPKDELFGLVSQMRRCSVSIPSNLAKGNMHGGNKEHIQFLRIAYDSGAESETQLLLAKDLKYIEDMEYNELTSLLSEVMKMLNKLIATLSNILKPNIYPYDFTFHRNKL
jgi:four helix bundle protein